MNEAMNWLHQKREIGEEATFEITESESEKQKTQASGMNNDRRRSEVTVQSNEKKITVQQRKYSQPTKLTEKQVDESQLGRIGEVNENETIGSRDHRFSVPLDANDSDD